MSSPLNPLPDPIEDVPSIPVVTDDGVSAQVQAVLPPPQKSFPAWSGWDVLAISVFTGFCLMVFIVAALFVSGAVPGHKNLSIDQLAGDPRVIRIFLGGQAAAYLVALAFIALTVRSRAVAPFGSAIRWNWPRLLAPAFFVGGIVLALAIDGISRFLPIPKSLPIEDLFNDPINAYLLAAFGLTLAPLLEELFFRGLLYPVLRRKSGVIAAVLLTALAFAAIHSVQLGYAWAPILSIFVVGIVFTLIRVRYDSVAASFLMHCGYNFTLFSLLWMASDHFRHFEKAAG